MIATTTLSWTLLIASISAVDGQIQALTSIAGFGSEEGCMLAREVTDAGLPADTRRPLMLCLPVDASRPLPDMLKNLLQPE